MYPLSLLDPLLTFKNHDSEKVVVAIFYPQKIIVTDNLSHKKEFSLIVTYVFPENLNLGSEFPPGVHASLYSLQTISRIHSELKINNITLLTGEIFTLNAESSMMNLKVR